MYQMLLPLMAVVTIGFEVQELPGLNVGAPGRLTAARTANFVHADLDGDGAPDLVMSHGVYFQRDGRFPVTGRVPLPSAPSGTLLDMWGATLYMKDDQYIRTFAWENGAWQPGIEAAIPRGASQPEEAQAPREMRRPKPELVPFLHDLDGDGVPEIVEPAPAGLRVFRLNGGQCAYAGMLHVGPALRIAASPAPDLWPEARRRIRLPVRHATCTLYVHGREVTVLERAQSGGRDTHFRRLVHTIDQAPNGEFKVNREPRVEEWPALPATLAPCRLNADDVLDFADITFEDTGTLPTRSPAYTVRATLDGGKTFAVRRGRAHHPQPPFVDFNGNGALDLVTEETDLYSGGLWGWATRMTTRSYVRHVVRVYPQNRGAFARKPALEAVVRVRFPAPPQFDQKLYPRYRGLTGTGLINLTGDVNGDGYKDLLVNDQPGRIAVYLAAGFGFPDQPNAYLEASGLRTFTPADVNGNGRDDIVVLREIPDDAGNPTVRTFVYFSGAPMP